MKTQRYLVYVEIKIVYIDHRLDDRMVKKIQNWTRLLISEKNIGPLIGEEWEESKHLLKVELEEKNRLLL